jgi:hypothetical protein
VSDADVSEFLEAQGGPVTSCAVCELLPRLTAEQQEKLAAAFAHPRVNSTGILGVLRDWGYTLDRAAPDKVVQNHRKNHVGR